MIDVYCVTSPSGRRYVGIASAGAAARWRSHVFDSRHGSRLPLHNAIRKYGAQVFRREVLQRCTTRSQAIAAERWWISELNTQTPRGYNATAGGDGTHGLSKAARARISAAHKGRTFSAEALARMSASHIGQTRPQTPEHRARISAALMGKTLSTETRRKLRDANLGKKQSAETKAKRASSMRAVWARRSVVERTAVGAAISAGRLARGAGEAV